MSADEMPIKIEEARAVGPQGEAILVGWRLTETRINATVLVFADGDIMNGFRLGYEFVPKHDEKIEYRELEPRAKVAAEKVVTKTPCNCFLCRNSRGDYGE